MRRPLELLGAWTAAEGADRVRALLHSTCDVTGAVVWSAPGRVNLIGEHVDYNGGRCLPVALPHRTFVAARRRGDDLVRLVSAQTGAGWSGTVTELTPEVLAGWAAYVGGPAWSLLEAGFELGGFELAVDSCVPLGAGLSSSAAVECAVAIALDDLFDLGLGRDDAGRARLAALCVRAENTVAGAPTGGMDQAVSLRARSGHALLFDASDASVAHLPLDLDTDGLGVLVIDTRAAHALHDGQYGERRATCAAACAVLGVTTLRDVDDPEAALTLLADETMRRRVRHVLTEIDRVDRFAELLSAGRLRDTGPLLAASHASLRDDYEVSCRELDVAVDAARAAGALGARMTGGGFGGSAIALVEAGSQTAVATAVSTAFANEGLRAPAFLTVDAAGGPAARVD